MTLPDVTELRLKNECVNVLLKWNKGRSRKSTLIDTLFVEYLLVSLVGTEKIKSKELRDEVVAVIKGVVLFGIDDLNLFIKKCMLTPDLFKVRLDGDVNRLNKFEHIIQNKCNDIQGRPLKPNRSENREVDRVSGDLAFVSTVSSDIYRMSIFTSNALNFKLFLDGWFTCLCCDGKASRNQKKFNRSVYGMDNKPI